MKLHSSWDEEFDRGDSISTIVVFALTHVEYCKKFSPVHPDVCIVESLIRLRDFKRLCEYELSYPDSVNPESVFHLRQALAFFSKNVEADYGVDRDAIAYEKFVESESRCLATNTIFKLWSQGKFCFSPDVESWIFRAQRKIARVLGDVPTLSDVGLRFGPGSTTSTKKRNASVREKLHAPLACSEEFVPLLSKVLDELPVLSLLQLEEVRKTESLAVKVDYGKVTFVPKSAKTNRAVVTEPVLNGMLQLGYGDIIAVRLRAVGVDTRDQSLNQRLAREGSLTNALATLDLSSASDTISTELVFHLLPIDWAFALSYARTRTVSVRGKLISQEKFSSMGNGYTFPLETLIFWALVSACCGDDSIVSVYGDDIIIPSNRFDDVSRLLSCVGFSVNPSKSFAAGPFRESCGKDYYKGIDIRPYYQKSAVSAATLFSYHNYLVRRGYPDLASLVVNFIHPGLRIYGPDGYGDGHLLGDWLPRPHKRNIGYSGFLFDTFTFKRRRDIRPVLPGDWVVPLYSVYVREVTHGKSGVEMLRYYHGTPLDSAPLDGFTYPGVSGYKKVSIYTLNIH